MIFGEKQSFAIEAELGLGNVLQGKSRMWICGQSVGKYRQEYLMPLFAPLNYLCRFPEKMLFELKTDLNSAFEDILNGDPEAMDKYRITFSANFDHIIFKCFVFKDHYYFLLKENNKVITCKCDQLYFRETCKKLFDYFGCEWK